MRIKPYRGKQITLLDILGEHPKEDKMDFNFPPSKFIYTETLRGQLEHIKTEVDEVEQALDEYERTGTKEALEHLGVEGLDLIHSGQTFVLNMEHRDARLDLKHCKLIVLGKNNRRRYYTIDKGAE